MDLEWDGYLTHVVRQVLIVGEVCYIHSSEKSVRSEPVVFMTSYEIKFMHKNFIRDFF